MTATRSAPPPFPAGTTFVADPTLRLRSAGCVLLGGAPMRIVRVSTVGADLVRGWLSGRPVDPAPGPTELARRLVEAGMLHPRPPERDPSGPLPSLTVVVPVRDDPDGLRATLAGLVDLPVVVVDDGSRPPVAPPPATGAPSVPTGARSAVPEPEVDPSVAAGAVGRSGPPVRLIRRAVTGGPGAARQTGLASAPGPATELVAFVDAGVEVSTDQLHRLTDWFDDEAVVAVGPRVRPSDDGGPLTGYETDHSPLDLGSLPSPVGPGRLVAYLPTACLLVRWTALDAVGGFDPDLRYGEDVDLVWRLLDQGQIRYDPSVEVTHPARGSFPALLAQRLAYGRSAGPLAARHGDRVAPLRLSRWSLAVWVLALTGRPRAAVGLVGISGALLRRKLAPVVPDPGAEAARLIGVGHWWAGRHLSDVAVRVWWPVTALALFFAPTRGPALRLAGWAWIRRLVVEPGRPGQRARRLGLTMVDDAAYGAGVWLGAWRARSIRSLLPVLAEWPGRRPLATGTADGQGRPAGPTRR